MSDDLDALLRDHYRRAAEGVRPDPELIDRFRNTARPARAVPGWPRLLLAAAAVAAIALVAWGLLRPDHRAEPSDHSVPIAPPSATTVVTPSPEPSVRTARPRQRTTKPERRTPSARPTPTPRPTRTAAGTPSPSSTTTPSSTPRPTGR
ncbi:hypothetical protein GCM10023195_52280 [Actinoallomurus liliacearum]|uniref:DUF3040 domain-containing protein n=1 Tax=Actinoallomurus liliacearum TaxID=1080073 RepID=A0ABP8TN19_9ACTN